MKPKRPRILILDIETQAALALVWRFFDERISPSQVLEHGSILSFAAKWRGKKKIFFHYTYKSSEKTVLKELNKLLDEADATVTHNGGRFDHPKIRGRSLVHGLPPPSPVKEIDTLQICKREFGFDSNSLEYIAKVLGCKKQKTKHKRFPGFELWLGCLRDDPKAWAELKAYNIHDVRVTEEVYDKILPYARQHPNMAVLLEHDGITCPKCGGTRNQRRGWAFTNVGKFRRYQCMTEGCRGWHRGRRTEYPKELGKALTVSVVS